MERDVNRRTTPPAHIGTAEMSLAMWLRSGRAQKSLTLDDVARITKIQPRILERLEAGKLDGLPAEVFVRGFVRSFARCVGLDEAEALRRYAACATPVSGRSVSAAPAAARAMIEAMGDLAPNARDAGSPGVARGLRDEPTHLAAGSMEIASERLSEPSIEITFGSLEEPPVEVEVPVEITFAEASEVISIDIDHGDPGPAAVGSDMVASVASGSEVSEVDTVVVAPPADMNLSAVPAPSKKKRTRRAAGDAAAAPKRRRSKVANGTPSEPTAIIAAEIDAGMAVGAEGESTEAAAPKRRRKPRGSVQPPIAAASVETGASTVVASTAVASTAVASTAVASTAVASAVVASTAVASADESAAVVESAAVLESSVAVVAIPSSLVEVTAVADANDALVDAAGEISASTDPLPRRVDLIDDTAAIDDADAPFASALEFAAIEAPSVDFTFDSSSTSRFERSDDMQLPDEVVEQIESTWTPRMPAFPIAPTTSWRRSAAAPALVAVIDDADPEGAERTLEDRRGRESRRTFLPPILMDRDGDRSARQGGLTLAVIILLIAATLTLSYLMRRPSAGGDGVTQLDDTTEINSIG